MVRKRRKEWRDQANLMQNFAQPMKNSPTASPEEIREELQRILASEDFEAATRARRFLSYIVEETLSGREDQIKELVLGVEVFDRPSDFDPRIDASVRVEAGKLRKRLDSYYKKDGAAAAVAIEIPKGSYVPQFIRREAASVPGAPRKAGRWWIYLAGAAAVGLLLAAWLWNLPPQASASPSVAVLPFLNLSADPSNEYFADGLAEELTDALAGMGNLRVTSRTSAFSFKGKQVDVRDIGTHLQVGAVVEGSVRKDGDRIRITAQLVRTDDGYHLWSESFDRDLKDILAVQEEIASAVAGALQIKLAANQSQRLNGRTANVEAFDLYLKGLSFANPQTTAEAERLFKAAIAVDPSFSKAHAALARTYLMGDFGGVRPTVESIDKAKTALAKALSLNDRDAETHVASAELAARYEFDWEAGELHIQRALEIDPNSALAHWQLAQNILAPQSRLEEAIAENQRAARLDPFDPVIATGGHWLKYLQRDFEGARKGFSLPSESRNWLSLMGLGMTLQIMGRHDEALAVFHQVQEIFPQPYILGFIGVSRAKTGDLAGARKMLVELTELSKTHYVSPSAFVPIYVALNDRNRGFEHLQRALAEHDSPLIFLRVEPIFDPVRNDPRFEQLLEKVGLSDKQIRDRQTRIGTNYR